MGPIGYLINGYSIFISPLSYIKKFFYFKNFEIKGVPIYNMMDGFSYSVATGTCTTTGSGVWQRNAYAYEGISFDSCGGHPDAFSSYHK